MHKGDIIRVLKRLILPAIVWSKSYHGLQHKSLISVLLALYAGTWPGTAGFPRKVKFG